MKYDNKGAWILPEKDIPFIEYKGFQLEKLIISIIWGVHGFYVIDTLLSGISFNSSYFIEHILNLLEAVKSDIQQVNSKTKCYLHLDNCKVHNSMVSEERIKAIGFLRTPYPPYSSDIAPSFWWSDFFLFV